MTDMILHGFWRSSASWRVRIAMGMKGISWSDRTYRLRAGEQRSDAYLTLNPQGLVPALEIDGAVLTQSLAICEYLEELYPDPPLLPADPLDRARVRGFAQAIACDIHPIQNLKVLRMLGQRGLDEDTVQGWAREVIESGLEACSRLIADRNGSYCFGDSVTLADVVLIPQLHNARRFGARIDYPRIEAIEAACSTLPAFAAAHPARQPDAE
ncbi:maleylacetoacetate isomerase [Sphingobium sp. HBC34]|uniref:Maleylacetoacetate isomerase n=1 Tax=Sphingobium cyanobacteriorum TaxID=3063954 RepID=A0ABT8ZML0_9SPHN|nr:maleylacetoacetate isomerase [Sphingobium sp. HBC34]MDO7835769.1 maleylacetoacetate isomerase [Sphingobium sp. HBC34]